MTSAHEVPPRRRHLALFIGLPLGLLLLAMDFSRPTIANMRTVDIVLLLGTGACLGTGLMAVVLHFFGRREG